MLIVFLGFNNKSAEKHTCINQVIKHTVSSNASHPGSSSAGILTNITHILVNEFNFNGITSHLKVDKFSPNRNKQIKSFKI